MPSVDLDRLGQYVDLPATAARLLAVPEKQVILHLTVRTGPDEVLSCKAYVVYYNTARGPAKGGIRIWPTATLESTTDLAERMVWKTALVGIPFGGGKSSIALDAGKLPLFVRNELVREFVHVIEGELSSGAYIPAPDLGSGPSDMAIIFGQTHQLTSVTGKPPRVGGLPGRLEATGYGVAHTAGLFLGSRLGKDVSGATAAVQGFGNVGGWTAAFLAQGGARVVAVSDMDTALYAKDGLDVGALQAHYEANGRLAGFPAEEIAHEDVLTADVDVLVPAATGGVFDAKTAAKVRARLIVEGANGPTTPEGDAVFGENGVAVAPDILANSGGVVASYVEWRNAKSGSITDATEVFKIIESVLGRAAARTQRFAGEHDVDLRTAAECLAVNEVVETMRDRAWL
jgi:glutamate dehydrogenase (NAD(P)+)